MKSYGKLSVPQEKKDIILTHLMRDEDIAEIAVKGVSRIRFASSAFKLRQDFRVVVGWPLTVVGHHVDECEEIHRF